MDGECSMHGRNETCTLIGNMKGRDHLEDLRVDGKIISEVNSSDSG
jgi:hypothetical protein